MPSTLLYCFFKVNSFLFCSSLPFTCKCNMMNILFPGQTLLIANYSHNFRSLGMIESLGNFIHHYILHFALLNKNMLLDNLLLIISCWWKQRERGGGLLCPWCRRIWNDCLWMRSTTTHYQYFNCLTTVSVINIQLTKWCHLHFKSTVLHGF